MHARLRARLARKNKPLKAEREPAYPEVNNSVVADTPAPLSIVNSHASESFLRRAQDSFREKRTRMFGTKKVDSDSDSSSRRLRSKKKLFGAEKDQLSDRKNTNSDKSAKKEASDRKKLNDDGSEKKKKDESERERERKRKNDDSSKKK